MWDTSLFNGTVAIPNGAGGCTSDDGESRYIPSNDSPCCYNRPISDFYSCQYKRICSDPNVISNINSCLSTFLMGHRSADSHSMIMVDKLCSASNQAMISNFYSVRNVKFTSESNVTVISDYDTRTQFINSIVVEVYVGLELAVVADPDLVRVRDENKGDFSPLTQMHSLSRPIKSTETT